MFERLKEKMSPPIKMYPERPETLRLLPGELLTPLARMHIQKTLKNGGAIVTLRRGETYLSLAVMMFAGKDLVLTYLGTAPAHRNQGYAARLLRELLAVTDRSKTISCSVDRRHEGAPYMAKLLEKQNFQKVGCYYSCWINTTIISAEWKEKMAEMFDRYRRWFERRGFRLLSFRDASPELLEQIRLSRTNEFKNALDPAVIFSIPGYILYDRSYLMEKDGRVAAYSLCSSAGKGVIEGDQIAAAEDYRGTGVIAVPLLATFVPVINDPELSLIRYQVYEQNQNMQRVMGHVVESGTQTQTMVDAFHYTGQ